MNSKELIVVALGGNAITRSDEKGTVDQQFANCRATATQLADLIAAGHQLTITHGNGPQIGNFLVRNEAAAHRIHPLPVEVAVAHVQGGMGFMIAQTLTNELNRRGIPQIATAIVTTVLCDRNDPAFKTPTKPIGRTLSTDEAKQVAAEGWVTKEITPGQFRRVIASPVPQRIVEIEAIRRAVRGGELLVACGGGGVPVVEDPNLGLVGVAAVIDKDLATALLAAELKADVFLILTAVDRVRINFGKPDERSLERMTVAQAKQWLAQGQFPAGSMGPKVQAAINFLEARGSDKARVIIAPLDGAADAIVGRIGTTITLR